MRGNLEKIVTIGTKCFVRYSWHERYFGCLLLRGFIVKAKTPYTNLIDLFF